MPWWQAACDWWWSPPAPHLFEREVAVVVRHVLHVDVQQLVRH